MKFEVHLKFGCFIQMSWTFLGQDPNDHTKEYLSLWEHGNSLLLLFYVFAFFYLFYLLLFLPLSCLLRMEQLWGLQFPHGSSESQNSERLKAEQSIISSAFTFLCWNYFFQRFYIHIYCKETTFYLCFQATTQTAGKMSWVRKERVIECTEYLTWWVIKFTYLVRQNIGLSVG